MNYHRAINWGRFWELVATWGFLALAVGALVFTYFIPTIVEAMQ